MSVTARKERPDYRGPAPPKPESVRETLNRLDEMRKILEREYGEVFEFAYTVGLPNPEFGRGKPKSSVSDPTGETMSAQAKQECRKAAWMAAEKIADALGSLRAAKDLLLHSLPDPERLEPTMAIYPRTVRDAEVIESREAQERRRERGEF